MDAVSNSLVDCGHDLPRLFEFLEVRDTPVGDTDSPDLALGEHVLHLLPGLALVP